MYTNPTLVFLLGFAVFLFFAIWFFSKRKNNEWYGAAFLVSSITLVSYAVLAEGSLVAHNQAGIAIYYTRWLFYAASCSLLIVSIAKFLKTNKESFLPLIILNILVMLTGTLASVSAGAIKWLIFILGCLFFFWQIQLLFEGKAQKENHKLIANYIFFGWAVFPIVFILAPEGLYLINNALAALLYLALDLLTKIIFYLHVGSRQKS
ncbi:schizorhodopsin|nr:schizorhodopsin [Candidatus Uhrbacteria bacterium]